MDVSSIALVDETKTASTAPSTVGTPTNTAPSDYDATPVRMTPYKSPLKRPQIGRHSGGVDMAAPATEEEKELRRTPADVLRPDVFLPFPKLDDARASEEGQAMGAVVDECQRLLLISSIRNLVAATESAKAEFEEHIQDKDPQEVDDVRHFRVSKMSTEKALMMKSARKTVHAELVSFQTAGYEALNEAICNRLEQQVEELEQASRARKSLAQQIPLLEKELSLFGSPEQRAALADGSAATAAAAFVQREDDSRTQTTQFRTARGRLAQLHLQKLHLRADWARRKTAECRQQTKALLASKQLLHKAPPKEAEKKDDHMERLTNVLGWSGMTVDEESGVMEGRCWNVFVRVTWFPTNGAIKHILIEPHKALGSEYSGTEMNRLLGPLLSRGLRSSHLLSRKFLSAKYKLRKDLPLLLGDVSCGLGELSERFEELHEVFLAAPSFFRLSASSAKLSLHFWSSGPEVFDFGVDLDYELGTGAQPTLRKLHLVSGFMDEETVEAELGVGRGFPRPLAAAAARIRGLMAAPDRDLTDVHA